MESPYNEGDNNRIGYILLSCWPKESHISLSTTKYYRLLVTLCNMTVKSYCRRHYLLMLTNMEKLILCPARIFTPLTGIHGAGYVLCTLLEEKSNHHCHPAINPVTYNNTVTNVLGIRNHFIDQI